MTNMEGEMQEVDQYAAIMARVAEVTWVMPAARPDGADAATRQEYTDDGLYKAAEIMFACWEASHATSWDGEYRPEWEDRRERFLAAEIAACRKTLDHGGPRNESLWEAMRWRALQIQNLPRVLASSSQARERTERLS